VTSLYACDQIPTAANTYSGQNFDFWCNQEATALAKRSDQELDPAKRLPLIHQLGALVRKDLVWFPLYQKTLITAWRTDKIKGPIATYNETGLGGFANLSAWTKP
jgi:peptide/nickel transport system substrate-binding protein